MLGSGRYAGALLKSSSTTSLRFPFFCSICPKFPENLKCTGPGVPYVATLKACLSKSGNLSTSSTYALNFVTESNAEISSTS